MLEREYSGIHQDEGAMRQHFSLWMKVGLCADWTKVLHLGRKMVLKKNSTTLGEGELIGGIYFVAKGVLRLTSLDEEGNEAILLYITDQNLFGDSAYFNKMPVYASVSSVVDSTLYFFPRLILERDIFPQYAELKENMLEYMAYKVGVLLHHQCELLTNDILGKVCRIIYDVAQYNNYKKVFHSQITQQEMATALGLHRATLSKAISDLKHKRVLDWANKQEVIIRNYEKLHQYTENIYAL